MQTVRVESNDMQPPYILLHNAKEVRCNKALFQISIIQPVQITYVWLTHALTNTIPTFSILYEPYAPQHKQPL
jgi:penicillin-binding protein-related factor A (putative recombinase)